MLQKVHVPCMLHIKPSLFDKPYLLSIWFGWFQGRMIFVSTCIIDSISKSSNLSLTYVLSKTLPMCSHVFVLRLQCDYSCNASERAFMPVFHSSSIMVLSYCYCIEIGKFASFQYECRSLVFTALITGLILCFKALPVGALLEFIHVSLILCSICDIHVYVYNSNVFAVASRKTHFVVPLPVSFDFWWVISF